jgi:hypothetical protein
MNHLDQLIEPMAKHFGLTVEVVRSKLSRKEVVICRDFCSGIIQQCAGLQISVIARYFNKNHSSIHTALERLYGDHIHDHSYKEATKLFYAMLAEHNHKKRPSQKTIVINTPPRVTNLRALFKHCSRWDNFTMKITV